MRGNLKGLLLDLERMGLSTGQIPSSLYEAFEELKVSGGEMH